jgi:hypothetical protein
MLALAVSRTLSNKTTIEETSWTNGSAKPVNNKYQTYKAPSEKMAMRVIFCRLVICSLLMNGIGNMRITVSIAMLRLALAKNRLFFRKAAVS